MKGVCYEKHLLLPILLLISFAPLSMAEINNRDALEGLAEMKAVFDINQGNPDILKLRLELIEMTYQQLKKAGVSPISSLRFGAKRVSF